MPQQLRDLEHDPGKWVPVLGKGLPPQKRGSWSNNNLKRDDDWEEKSSRFRSNRLGCRGLLLGDVVQSMAKFADFQIDLLSYAIDGPQWLVFGQTMPRVE